MRMYTERDMHAAYERGFRAAGKIAAISLCVVAALILLVAAIMSHLATNG